MLYHDLAPELRTIAEKVENGTRITPEEGILLFEKGSLSFVGALANIIRERKNGDKVFFNRNFHMEPTNVCIYTCDFCSYSRRIKKREDGWELTLDQMLDQVRAYNGKHVTEVHIVGGVLPQYDLKFYEDLFRGIHEIRPELHIKALTPVEFFYIFKKAKVDYTEGFRRLKAAGLQSIPGGGAEIFHPEVREKICADKCTGQQWLDMHEAAHALGLRSNATMLYGHVENYMHRIDHLTKLRDLQDRTGGFQTFIPLKFRNQDNEMSHLTESTTVEDLRCYAISRIFLDNFDHIKAYWPMIGRSTAQLSLAFGVDDIDGTIDDSTKIYAMAGSEEQNPALTTQELVQIIRRVNRKPIERDTLYNVVTDYTDTVFDEDTQYKGYLALPVVQN